MLDVEKKYYLEDVIEITAISERNIKFWVAEYHLNVYKEGRKNVYPPQTITLLNLIKELTESKFFTTRFIQIQVERCKNPHRTNIKGLQSLNEITKKMLQYIFEMTDKNQEEKVAEAAVSNAVAEPEAPKITERESEEDGSENTEPVAVAPTTKPKPTIVIDDFAHSSDEEDFQTVTLPPRDETMKKILKELRSPIITLADEPKDKKSSFWRQLKNILK